MDYLADPDPSAFDWVNEPNNMLSYGGCIALVQDSHPHFLFRKLLANPTVGPAPAVSVRAWAELESTREANLGNYGNYATAIEAGQLDGWTIVVEMNGYRATEAPVLTALSEGTAAVVMYTNVNAGRIFAYANDGKIVRQFDPLQSNYCEEIGTPLAAEEGLDFDSNMGRPDVDTLRLVARLSGIVLTPDVLADSSSREALGWFPLRP